MMYTLVFLSFLADFVLIYIIIHLFQRIKQLESQNPAGSKQEIEETLTAYITDIREENQAFLEALESKKKDDQKKIKPMLAKETPSKKKAETKEKPSKEAFDLSYEPIIEETEESFEPSLASRVLTLKSKGMSVTEIAQSLNKGKGEVELLLKLKQ